MPWIEPVAPEEASHELRTTYEEIRRQRGRIANVYLVQSHNPPALRAHLDLYMSLLYRKGGLSRAQREMIGVLVSSLNGCRYCVVHHAEALARYESSSEVMEALQRDARGAPLSDADRAMLAYAAKLTRDPGTMGEKDVEDLRANGFDDEAILDINLIASYFSFVNRLVQGLGVELEGEEERVYRY